MAAGANESNGSLQGKSLRKKRVNREHNSNFRAGYVHIDEDYLHKTGLRGRKICCFFTILTIMLIIIIINFVITLMLLSVLKINIWSGMTGVEFTHNPDTGASIVKFLQQADLGNLITPDDTLSSFKHHSLQLEGYDDEAVIVGASYRTIADSDRIVPSGAEGLSYCESERQSLLEHLSADSDSAREQVVVPECDRDGLYREVQCKRIKARHYCWCVHVQTGHALTDQPTDVTQLTVTSTLTKLLNCPQQKHNVSMSTLSVSPAGISLDSVAALRLFQRRPPHREYFSSALGERASLTLSHTGGDSMELRSGRTGQVYRLVARQLTGFLTSDTVITNKVSSGMNDNLRILSVNGSIHIVGNERLNVDGLKISMSTQSDHDITMRSQFGSILLSGSTSGSITGGIRVTPGKLSLAGEVPADVDGFERGLGRGYEQAHKLCVCLPRGNLFLVDVREAHMGCDTASEMNNPCL